MVRFVVKNVSLCNYDIKKNSIVNQPSFMGKHCTTDLGNQYYHTNIGRNIGIASCALLTGTIEIFNRKKPKVALDTMLVTTPLIIMGIISDKIRNNKNKENADLIAKYGFDKMSKVDKFVCVSNNEHPYKECHSATLVGGIMCIPLLIAAFTLSIKKSMKSGQAVMESLRNALKYTFNITVIDECIGPLLIPLAIGAGIDSVANKEAQKKA